jgi:hypothetical protein
MVKKHQNHKNKDIEEETHIFINLIFRLGLRAKNESAREREKVDCVYF